MNKFLSGFISGVVVGAAGCYIYVKHFQKKSDVIPQNELAEYKLSGEESSENVPEDEETEDDEEAQHKEMYNYASRSEKLRKANREREEDRKIFRSVKHQDYLDDMIGGDDDDLDDIDDLDDPYSDEPDPYYDDGDLSPGESGGNDPYSISADTFANTCNHFDKCTLFWYSHDDVLADEENERITDENIVGLDWRRHVGEYEQDVAYIRNERISTDYEIVKEDLSFFKDAL